MAKRYSYAGPVCVNGVCHSNEWYGETWAVNQSKAISNLAYQYKKAANISLRAKITLECSNLSEGE